MCYAHYLLHWHIRSLWILITPHFVKGWDWLCPQAISDFASSLGESCYFVLVFEQHLEQVEVWSSFLHQLLLPHTKLIIIIMSQNGSICLMLLWFHCWDTSKWQAGEKRQRCVIGQKPWQSQPACLHSTNCCWFPPPKTLGIHSQGSASIKSPSNRRLP